MSSVKVKEVILGWTLASSLCALSAAALQGREQPTTGAAILQVEPTSPMALPRSSTRPPSEGRPQNSLVESDTEPALARSVSSAGGRASPPTELARRMNDALLGRAASAAHPRARPPTQSTQTAVWRCGPWQELWQGSGSARTCEWRSAAQEQSRP